MTILSKAAASSTHQSLRRAAVETRAAMPYVRDGTVLNRRSPYRLSIITDIFWGVVNLISALCVPAHQIPRASSSSRRALRFVALTLVSRLARLHDTRLETKQLSIHVGPRVRGVVWREAAAKTLGRVRRQRRRWPGPRGRRRRRRPPGRKRTRRFSHPRARPQRPSGRRLRQVGVFRAIGPSQVVHLGDSHARGRAVSLFYRARRPRRANVEHHSRAEENRRRRARGVPRSKRVTRPSVSSHPTIESGSAPTPKPFDRACMKHCERDPRHRARFNARVDARPWTMPRAPRRARKKNVVT